MRRRRSPRPPFDLTKVLFKQQLPFGLAQSRYQTAVTPRRAGKTYAIAAKLLSVAQQKRGCTCLYITLSRINAKRIVWETLKELNRVHELGGVIGEADLCIAMPNGSRIYLSGASNRGEVEKFRGLALGIVILDEAQAFPSFLEQLVDEVLVPALTDYAGQLCLVGTPGPVPVGYFFDKTTNPEWSHFGWSVFDNVHLEKKSGKPTRQLYEEEKKRRGVTDADPIIRREWFGEWVLDENSLVFRWSPRNARDVAECDSYVVGVDLGFDDADAIAVLGWDARRPDVQLVYEKVTAKQALTPLFKQVAEVYEKYQPLAIVVDTGGLGKKIAEELQSRVGIPVEAADKARKLEHIELLNDALRSERFFAPASSRFAFDCMKVEWDKSNPEKPKIAGAFHSDVCDAVLYAYMKALHWLYVPEKPKTPKLNTPEWYAAEAERQQKEIDSNFERQIAANKSDAAEERMAEEWS